MTMTHVIASVKIHQLVLIHTSMIHILASVSARHTHVHLISTLTMIPVAAAAMNIQTAQATNTSMTHHVNAIVVMSRNAAQENTTTMTHVNVSVVICHLVLLPTIMIPIHVNVFVGLTIATRVSTLTLKAVAASAQSTRPAQTISISMEHLANVNVK